MVSTSDSAIANSWGTDGGFLAEEPEVGRPYLIGPLHGLQHQDTVAHRRQANCVRWRIATLTIAVRSVALSASRSRTYGSSPALRARGSTCDRTGWDPPDRTARTRPRRCRGPGHGQVLQILGLHDEPTPGRVLVSLGDLAVRQLPTADLTLAFQPDPAAVLGVDLMEPDVVILSRGVHLHGHIHEPECHRPFPQRSHSASMSPCAHARHPGRQPTGPDWVFEVNGRDSPDLPGGRDRNPPAEPQWSRPHRSLPRTHHRLVAPGTVLDGELIAARDDGSPHCSTSRPDPPHATRPPTRDRRAGPVCGCSTHRSWEGQT